MKKILILIFGWLCNLFAIPAFAARSTASDPLQKFKFRLSIPGIPANVGFQKVSGLSQEVGVAEYNEGGTDYTMKMPGIMKVPEVTCERGEYADDHMHELVKKTLTNPDLRKTVVISMLNRYGQIVRTYKLANCWASKWEGSDRDAGSDDVSIEKLTLQFEYFL